MMKQLKRKLQSQKAESLLEVLIAILIIAVTFSFLCTTISTASRVNKTINMTDVNFTYEGGSFEERTLIAVTTGEGNDSSIMRATNVELHSDKTGRFSYYE